MTAFTRWLAGVAAVLVLAGGCGDDATTGQVPELGARLDAVDEAVASHDYDTARSAIEELERSVRDASRSGDLDRSRAEEILGAAETLRHTLPDQAPAPAQTTPAESPSTPTEESDPEESESTPAPPPAPPGKEKKAKPGKHEERGKEHGHED